MMPMNQNPVPGGGGAPAPQEQANPEQMRSTLVKVLKEVARVAQENGFDFQELVSMVAGGGSQDVPPPPM